MIPSVTETERNAKRWMRTATALPVYFARHLFGWQDGTCEECTRPCPGNKMWLRDSKNIKRYGVVLTYNEVNGNYTFECDDGEIVEAKRQQLSFAYDETALTLTNAHYVFCFSNADDVMWLADVRNHRTISECGFRLFHSDIVGYFFVCDVNGHDAFREHWLPLYKARFGVKNDAANT